MCYMCSFDPPLQPVHVKRALVLDVLCLIRNYGLLFNFTLINRPKGGLENSYVYKKGFRRERELGAPVKHEFIHQQYQPIKLTL